VLKGGPYTQAADVYSFGMIMYFVATGKQPFVNYAHDEFLVLNICNGNRPEINAPEAPQCYIDLMKQCWDSNPDNRPKATDLFDLIKLFIGSYQDDGSEFKDYIGIEKEQQHYEIKKQIEEAQEYKRSHLSSFDEITTHPQAIYTTRLLNPFTKNLPKYDNIDNNTVEIIDFTK
jgi:serine/threonine protein kinase